MANANVPRGVDPRTVTSPKRSVADLWVIYDGGIEREGDSWAGWSVARMTYNENPAVGIRWNGEDGVNPGTPNSRGFPTWFILPTPFRELVIEAVNTHLEGKDDKQPNRLRRCVNELMAAARDATSEEMTRLQLYLS